MPITEDDVKKAVKAWLEERGFKEIEMRLGTRPGHDVEGINPESGKRLVVECKGETKAKNQRDLSWRNTSYALFNAIKLTEKQDNDDDVAIALPATKHYEHRLESLEDFCDRQGIAVYWISQDGSVLQW